MCATCGCDSDAKVSIHRVEKLQALDMTNLQFKPIENKSSLPNGRKQIDLEQDILLKNNLLAERNRNVKNESILFIENIGNLVCPAMFDLGEQKRVVIISVTEGEDKPLKYPDMFQSSQLCIINKIDLLPYLKFDLEALKKYGRRVNPSMEFIELSCTTGEGISNWYAWLKKQKHRVLELV
ncbi:MAG: hydrogenase nickel incorporation protein HypB [Flammeovirgaceae bacterium]|nr:hydrogenase nickel incorporation protein HypB [Flammeovirgaceae bacterium]